jgi:hypothetical protein
MINKPKFGTIVICNNVDKVYQEIDVEVTQWWAKGDKKYMAKEVRIPENSVYYKETVTKGWRRYNKFTVPKYNDEDFYTINFIPNKNADKSKNILYAVIEK